MTESDFGSLLWRSRIAAGLTQEALAERAGVSARAVSDLERGAHGLPRKDTLQLLLDALALSPAERVTLAAAARRPMATRARRARDDERPRLPVALTSLVGRETDIANVAALLTAPVIRLLTLTGPGGTGKTRLALAVAERVASAFPDGVVFVSLAPIGAPDLAASAIAERLGVRERAEQPLREALVAHLSGQRLLLVLDNFEHLRPAAPLVTDLLGACPALRVLTTSRAALHVTGEHLYSVSPLAVPEPDHLLPVDELVQTAAVRLFVERVQAVKPGFAVSEANAPAVVKIVRRLDGLPLALELVAARARVLPPAALAERLEHSLPLLTGGVQDLPVRHRTLRETIAWSYDLLPPTEKTLFRRLGVFAGGWTFAAAEEIANPDGLVDIVDGIAALLDSSLLHLEEQGMEPRYTMLETVREYALERLGANGEETITRGRHAAFYLAQLGWGDPDVVDNGDPGWSDMIERDHDNLRAALAWSRETGDSDALLRLAGALAPFWYYRGYLSEGQRWLSLALETPADDASPGPRAWALTMSGNLANVCGETDRAAELLQESFTLWELANDAYGQMTARQLLGGVRVNQGKYDAAAALFAANEAYFRDNEAYLRNTQHEDWLGHATFHLGLIAWMQGNDMHARAYLRDTVTLYDRIGERVMIFDPLRYLGLIACAAGELDDAAKWFAEELSRLQRDGSRAALAVGLADVATLAASREAWHPAARLFAKAEALLHDEGAAFSLPAREHYERARHQARDALGVAGSAAEAAGRALTLEQALAEAEALLAHHHDGSAGSVSVPGPGPEHAPHTG